MNADFSGTQAAIVIAAERPTRCETRTNGMKTTAEHWRVFKSIGLSRYAEKYRKLIGMNGEN